MVTVKDILELRKRMTLHDTNIVRIAGVYVSNEKEQITKLNERALKKYETYKQKEAYKQLLSKAQKEIVNLAEGDFTETAQEIEDLLKRS